MNKPSTMEERRRFFNTTGPCNPERHFMLSPKDRLVGAQLSLYMKDELYWVIHAPRQTGKTTFLQSCMREINTTGKQIACYVLVVLFDEIGVLVGETMISFLRQLQRGFASRGTVGKFSISTAFVGMRDLKDDITLSKKGVAPNTAESSYLAIFDRGEASKDLPWEKKIKWETEGDITIVWQ